MPAFPSGEEAQEQGRQKVKKGSSIEDSLRGKAGR
jgi:hypothetical protein